MRRHTRREDDTAGQGYHSFSRVGPLIVPHFNSSCSNRSDANNGDCRMSTSVIVKPLVQRVLPVVVVYVMVPVVIPPPPGASPVVTPTH